MIKTHNITKSYKQEVKQQTEKTKANSRNLCAQRQSKERASHQQTKDPVHPKSQVFEGGVQGEWE